MESLPVFIASILQLYGYSIFINQPLDVCSPAPTLGSWLFLLATICFLRDINIYPRRFMHMSKLWMILIELVASIFLAEIATLIIWCGLERVVYYLTNKLLGTYSQDECEQGPIEYWMHGLTTTLVGGALLLFILKATDATYYLASSTCKLKRNWKQTWRMLSCICRMNPCDRRRTLKACQMAMCPTQRRRSVSPYDNDYEDGEVDYEDEEEGEEEEEEE